MLKVREFIKHLKEVRVKTATYKRCAEEMVHDSNAFLKYNHVVRSTTFEHDPYCLVSYICIYNSHFYTHTRT